MTPRRIVFVTLGVVLAVVLAVALYLAFADLGRHKTRIEAMVTRSVGRPFAIDGPFTLKLFPVIAVSAERVRLGNMQGGSAPQMIEFGGATVHIGFWSLISGPPDVRLFELNDATVLLERGRDGKGNWVFGPPRKEPAEVEAEAETNEEDEPDDETADVKVPLIIRSAKLSKVRLIYREPKKTDRVVDLDSLSITPGQEGLLALDGAGKLDTYPLALKGEVGPLKALLSAHDMRTAMRMSLGDLALDLKGVIGSLSPLDRADLEFRIEHAEFGGMLEKLQLPNIAAGAMRIKGSLKDAGDLTQLDFKAKVGELEASSSGTLKALSLVGANLSFEASHSEIGALLTALSLPAVTTGPLHIEGQWKRAGSSTQIDIKADAGDLAAKVKGRLKKMSLVGSDLEFEATAADAARLASVFDIRNVPAAPLTVNGHTLYSRKQVKFDPVTVAIAGATATANGSWQFTQGRNATLQFDVAAQSLSKLKESWPQSKFSAKGALELTKERLDAKDLHIEVGENQLAGQVIITEPNHIEAQFASPRLDLSPFFANKKPGDTAAVKAAPEKKKFMFDETPLHFATIKQADAKVSLTTDELQLGERMYRNVASDVQLEQGKIVFALSAVGAQEGKLTGSGTLTPADDGSAEIDLKIDLDNVRASLASEGLAPQEVPPLGVKLDIRLRGSSPRQMASGANGNLLLTQGPGKTRSGMLSTFGGDVVSQLGQKLNPFAKVDKFMVLDCTVARANIVNGQVAVEPLVIQTEKVTVTAQGNIDLRNEKLLFNFDTRPRKGIGVSPGMFTNPLIRLEGTLMSPRIGVGAKGLASGAVAAATGGMTVIAGGLLDRMVGEQDVCKKTLEKASKPIAR